MNKLRIFLADDHAVLRQGLKLLINAQTDMEVIGDAGDGKSAVQQAQEQHADVVVMDVSMPNLNGEQATKQLKKMLPSAKILALTRHDDSSYLQQLLRAGVDGYVLKQSDSEELIRAIRAVTSGGNYIDPAITHKIMGNYNGRMTSASASEPGNLSERESEMLRLIAQGYSNKEIANYFNLSVKTVEAHKANAMRKLDLQSRVDIVRYAMLRGWLQDT